MEVLNKLLACGKDGVTENQISVLSPYRAQCHIIEKDLAANGISKVSVTSIGAGGGGGVGYIDRQVESREIVKYRVFRFKGDPVWLA